MQASVGLFAGVVVYSAALGGLFALAFAAAFGRVGAFTPRAASVLLALGGFLGLYVVPDLKYPAGPPSVGKPETIGMRTALYFAMVLVSLVAMVVAVPAQRRLAPRLGDWSATLVAMAGYLAAAVLAGILLPAANEVPEGFPAVLLWRFRMASLGMQAVMWAAIGLAFGFLAEKAFAARYRLPPRAPMRPVPR